MPNWKLHNDWAVKLGIPRQIANLVNKREDRWKFDLSTTLDQSLKSELEAMPDEPPSYNDMAQMGNEYLRAWILHLLIDEIEDTCSFILRDEDTIGIDLYKESKEMFLGNALLRLVPDDILNFINSNIDELIQIMPIPEFHIEHDRLLKTARVAK